VGCPGRLPTAGGRRERPDHHHRQAHHDAAGDATGETRPPRSANWPDGPVTTVKVTSSLGDVTATFAEGAFAHAVLTPTTPNGMVCGNPYAVTWDPPPDVQGAERTRTASVQWFPDLPSGCQYPGDFADLVPAANPITFFPPAVCPGSTSLTTGTLAVQLSASDRPDGQGSATSCEGARACTGGGGGNVALLRTSYRCH
jgi:hypothetical protein